MLFMPVTYSLFSMFDALCLLVKVFFADLLQFSKHVGVRKNNILSKVDIIPIITNITPISLIRSVDLD